MSRMCVPRADDMIGPLVTMGVVHGQTACPLKIARTSWRLWLSAVSHAGEPRCCSECPIAWSVKRVSNPQLIARGLDSWNVGSEAGEKLSTVARDQTLLSQTKMEKRAS